MAQAITNVHYSNTANLTSKSCRSWDTVMDPSAGNLRWRLKTTLNLKYPGINFDHVEVGYTGKSTVAVFVAKGSMSAVIYDKTRTFPSDTLLATLTLLGTP